MNPDRALAAAQAAESSLVAYVSPEQAQGMAADQQSDLYSLGLMLHEMLTGTRPYLGETVSALLFQHIYAPVPDLPAVIPLLVEHPPYANLRDSVHV